MTRLKKALGDRIAAMHAARNEVVLAAAEWRDAGDDDTPAVTRLTLAVDTLRAAERVVYAHEVPRA